MSLWEIVQPGPASAEANMRRDTELLANLGERPILHLYDWESDSATYGHFIRPEEHLNLDGVVRCGLSLAKRPTGGGILFHTCDLAFSVLLPAEQCSENTLENYRLVNSWVAGVLERFLGGGAELLPVDPQPRDAASAHFCMAKPTIYDLVIEGRKVGGAAQRRTRLGLLHQATLALVRPDRAFLEMVLRSGTEVALAMEEHTYPLLADASHLEEARQELRELLVDELSGGGAFLCACLV